MVHIFALKAFTLVLTLINNGPRRPVIKPMTTAPGRTSLGVTFSIRTLPNLREDAVQEENLPWTAASSIAIVTQAHPHDKNVFQSMENFQNGLGFESSKMKRAPPIGAEKAAATPADAPAAMNYLLL